MLIEYRPPASEPVTFHLSKDLKSVWEIPVSYQCPVIGTCLTAAEHRKVVKKAGIRVKGLKDYEVHSIIMSHLSDDNKVSRRVESFLRHKFRGEFADMQEWDEPRIEAEWKQRYVTGDIAGLLFLIALRRDISMSFLRHVFGEVHMLSHAIIEKVSNANSEIATLRENLAVTTRELDESKRLVRRLMRENKRMLKELDAKRDNNNAAAETEPKTVVQPDCSRFDSEKRELEKKNSQLLWRISKLESENDDLSKQVRDHEALNVHLRGDIEELISHFTSFENLDPGSVSKEGKPDLLSQRILVVGGMTKIRHLYQHLVESSGGYFDYHDGYMKNGNNNLDAKVNRADLILCPVNCNSHNACLKVKKLCCKYNKTLKILSNASVSAISTALFESEQGSLINNPPETCSCGLEH